MAATVAKPEDRSSGLFEVGLRAGGTPRMMSLLSRLDHLVYVTNDVDATIDALEQRLAVRAAIGGRHPNWGTRNALVSLGPRTYLEIMGPDTGLPKPAQPRPFGIDAISKPRLATWVARADNIQSAIDTASRRGLDLGELQERSRKKPDGSVLTWTMTDLSKSRMDGIIPYFIAWGNTQHPAESSPKGCRLINLTLFHPDAGRANELLRALGFDLHVEPGPIALRATVESPNGPVVLE